MKLLYCPKCEDIIRLFSFERSCKCGLVRGKYINDLNAVYSNGIPIGIQNDSLLHATRNQSKCGPGIRFEAFVIPKECSTFIDLL